MTSVVDTVFVLVSRDEDSPSSHLTLSFACVDGDTAITQYRSVSLRLSGSNLQNHNLIGLLLPVDKCLIVLAIACVGHFGRYKASSF